MSNYSQPEAHSTVDWPRSVGDEHPHPRTVLAGLRPQLVIELARLAGSTLDDLQVTMQLMPWADRATLAAYSVVVLGEGTGRGSRKLTVQPVALDLVSAAAEVVASAADPAAVALFLDPGPDYQTAGRTVEVVEAVGAVEKLDAGSGFLVNGVVGHVAETPEGLLLDVLLTVGADPDAGSPGSKQKIRMITEGDFLFEASEHVVVAYSSNGSVLAPHGIAKAVRS